MKIVRASIILTQKTRMTVHKTKIRGLKKSRRRMENCSSRIVSRARTLRRGRMIRLWSSRIVLRRWRRRRLESWWKRMGLSRLRLRLRRRPLRRCWLKYRRKRWKVKGCRVIVSRLVWIVKWSIWSSMLTSSRSSGSLLQTSRCQRAKTMKTARHHHTRMFHLRSSRSKAKPAD